MDTRTPRPSPFLPAAEAFRDGRDTPRQFLERCLEQYEGWESDVRAFVHVDLARARLASDASSQRWKSGRPLSRIDGMPIGVKDILETAHLPTEQGSSLFVGWQSVRDAATVSAVREAGAVVVGKTVTTEFAATEPGPTRNPWDTRRTPGGSSSGSAAAVARGIVTAALGTQVIGSIIRPASYCGCFGYKPSLGALNRGGSFDYLSQSCAGVLAATLEEAWVVAREISSRVGGDPGFPGLSGCIDAPSAKKPATVALLQTDGYASLSSEAKQLYQSITAMRKSRGVDVLTRANSADVDVAEQALRKAGSLSRAINAWESRWPLNTYAADMDAKGLSQAMRNRLEEAKSMTLEDYQTLLKERLEVRSVYAKLATHVDACLTMSAPGVAPLGLASTGDPAFAVPASLLGVPAVSLPLFYSEGLPLGLQLLGFQNKDEEAFGYAAYLAGR